MKAKTLIIIILSILGISLLFSTMYDKKINSSKIAMHRCENNSAIILPKEYLPSSLQNANPKSYKYKIKKHFSLDWKNTSLTGLPDNIFKNYPCIASLDISNNDLNEIPTAVNNLTNLQKLYLQNNKITSARNDEINYKKFKNLQSINLSNNRITKLDFIPQTTTFFDFDASRNEIQEVNFINTSNRFVNSLNLSNNKLAKFPHDFYRLRNLVELDISRNKISGEILLQGLEKLETLNISNQITDSIGITSIVVDGKSCGDLMDLEASNNDIGSFTFNYTSTDRNTLTQLRTINFHANKFTNFPDLIYDCPSVNSLYLSENKLRFIKFKHQMPALRKLNLQNNQIKEIQKLNSIRKINSVNLSHNQLTRFPFFNDNPNLVELNLSHNKIDTLNHFLTNKLTTKSFEKINLSHNRIKSFDKSSKDYLRLQELDLSNNQITTFHCNDYPVLQKLDLSNNNLKNIICEKLHGFLQLEELNLSNNPNLTDIPITLFNSSNNLKIINITNTNLDPDLILFLTQYCNSNSIKLIK